MTDERRLRDERVVGKLDLLWNFTQLDEGPHEDVLRGVLAGDPTHVEWILAPGGRSFGVGAAGRGDAFARAVTDRAEEMLTRAAADAFAGMVLEGPPTDLALEMVLGDASWFRVGMAVEDFGALRTLLDAMDAPDDARERALRHEGTPGAVPAGIYLIQAPPDPWGVQVSTGLTPGTAGRPECDAVDDEPVVVEEIVDDGERTWIRRPGLADEDLIDWQDERGFGNEAAGRIGEIHGAMGVHAPVDLVWEQGNLRETLVYVYRETVE